MIITVISYSVNRVTQRMLPCANYFSRELYTPFSGRTLRHMKKEKPPPRYVLSCRSLQHSPGMAYTVGEGNYKTVKEVCALTGLTAKHLYYFHHENVVRAAAYANYSVAGNDGYKLYDDAAVEKLQQIALYYQLGLKRNEIRDLMRDPTYDSACALRQLLDRERRKRDEASRHIAALEYLCRVGLDAALHSVLRQMTLDELGQALLQSDPPQAPDAAPPDADAPEKTPLTL